MDQIERLNARNMRVSMMLSHVEGSRPTKTEIWGHEYAFQVNSAKIQILIFKTIHCISMKFDVAQGLCGWSYMMIQQF